ncbi:MAG: flagellar basal body rod protein FlgC [Ignavibacteriales bacterium]|nr:flagellar basal body rod protein FlgC [Ignavibacteriales bacterium]
MKIDKLFSGFNISSLGLSAQRKRMNAIATNMANAETTRTQDGGPYVRKVVVLKGGKAGTFASQFQNASIRMASTDANHFVDSAASFSGTESVPGAVESVQADDNSPFRKIFDPSHPDADPEGYVKLPNVNVVTEMVDMISASRAYEANVTVVTAEKTIAKDALDI